MGSYRRDMHTVSLLLVGLVGVCTGGTEQITKRGRDSSKSVDLLDGEFCVDISTFSPVEWREEEAESCTTEFVKKCEDKKENVCAEVVETECMVLPYTQCSLGMEEQAYSETKLMPRLFVEQNCVQRSKAVPHVKQVPHCRNVTKQHCVTLWEKDATGQQVWAGKEDCEPVTWQECRLVDTKVKFLVPEVTCSPRQELWYHLPQLTNNTQMTTTLSCEIKKSSTCVNKPRSDCKYIEWKECREEPVTSCHKKMVHVPHQEKVHKKKCLLPGESTEKPPTQSTTKGPRPDSPVVFLKEPYSG